MSGGLVWLIAWQGVMLAGFTLIAFVIGMRWYGTAGEGLRLATTMAFMTLALIQVCMRSTPALNGDRRSAGSSRTAGSGQRCSCACCFRPVAVYVPVLQRVLHTAPPTAADWGVILACSLTPLPIVEAVKLARRWMSSGYPRALEGVRA